MRLRFISGARDWITSADGFISTADRLAKEPVPNGRSVGLLVWQGTENSLKALCIGHEIVKTHDQSKIMAHIKDNNLLNQNDFNMLASKVQTITLSGNYTDLRYPGSDPKFWDNMPPNEIRKRVTAAKEVHQFCLKNLTTSGVL